MARSIDTIYIELVTRFKQECDAVTVVIDDPSTWSAVNLFRLFFYTVALSVFVIEKLFDTHKLEVDDIISRKKPHSLRWYAEKAKLFQYGYNLLPDSDQYDNSLLTDDQVTSSQIVKHAAVVEQLVAISRYGLRIKVAGIVNDDLGELPDPQLVALESYFQSIKDGGVPLWITSDPADYLKLKLRIFYNPQVLNGTGARIDGVDPAPVKARIKDYLKRLPFNGQFVLEYLIDEVQAVEGVVIAQLDQAQAKYAELPYQSIDVKYVPDAGYLRIYDDADLEITYIAQNVIR